MEWFYILIENNSPSCLYSSKNLINPFLGLDKCGLNEIPSPPPIVLGTWILGSPVGSTVWVGLGGTVCWKKYVTVANSEVSKTTRQPQFALSASCLQVQEWSSQFLVKSAACCHTSVSWQTHPSISQITLSLYVLPWLCCLPTARTNRELGVSGGRLLQRTWPHRVLNKCERLWDLELEKWWDTVCGT